MSKTTLWSPGNTVKNEPLAIIAYKKPLIFRSIKYKIWPPKWFFQLTVSFISFCKTLPAFDLFNYWTKMCLREPWTFVFLSISVGDIKNLNCLIDTINNDNLLIFKFRNSKFALKNKLINNSKTRMLANFEIPTLKMIWSSSFWKTFTLLKTASMTSKMYF